MKHVIAVFATTLAAVAILLLLATPPGGIPPLGTLLDPVDGLYRSARHSDGPRRTGASIDGLAGEVRIVRDKRGVPHIFASDDLDGIVALGYVTAQDRLFQLDFIPRAAAGRLAEVFGATALENDRYLRSTGMLHGARLNLQAIMEENELELAILESYARGVNAYLSRLQDADLPIEFRLLGYRPEPHDPLKSLLVLQYMNFDLSYASDNAVYTVLKQELGEDYDRLFPRHSVLGVPIVAGPSGSAGTLGASVPGQGGWFAGALEVLLDREVRQRSLSGTMIEGYREGKGSNNWGVRGRRSATGRPVLAGDMHLQLTLPAIWYEAHIVTPGMNTYGVTIPGSPLLVQSFNDYVAWAFTNTGSDQIDHYALELDEARRHYRFNGSWRPLDLVVDTFLVMRADPVVDTLRFAHFGPVVEGPTGAVAVRWTAHGRSRTMRALWHMNRARSLADFDEATREWDTPMQNILVADMAGNLSIRSTGHLPIRAGSHGVGLLDGTTDAFEWTGRVPFDQLPHALNPADGFLTSTNQQPAGPWYPYYLGHDWRDDWRSIRADHLLRAQPRHSVEDLKRYQADVHVVQRDLFAPLIDTLGGLSVQAGIVRDVILEWGGYAGIEESGPLAFHYFLASLRRLAWEKPPFRGRRSPSTSVLYQRLADSPEAPWWNVEGTGQTERAPDLLRLALEAASDSLEARAGGDPTGWRWGDRHSLLIRHITRAEPLRPFWRGPFAFPGFEATLSPAGGNPTLATASWRVVVDFAGETPRGWGVYPGGQSGDPLSARYDSFIPTFLAFEYFELLRPATPGEIPVERVSSRLSLTPGKTP
jgi:penicillin G amidase